jgi:serine/threonine protein kinase
MSLPPALRTVHQPPAPNDLADVQTRFDVPALPADPPPRREPIRDDVTATPLPPAPAAPVVPGLDHPKLPATARTMLTELARCGLLPAADVTRFVLTVGDRLPSLTTQERLGSALVHLGFLTEYQWTRAASGHLFGTVFGPYRVLDRLGEGTVGVVFLGEHTFLKRPVAIKVLAGDRADDPRTLDRFVTEARALAGLRHPHVVAAEDAGVIQAGDDRQFYLVLEPVTGGDLENHVYEHGRQPLAQVAAWGWQAATGLAAAHRAGLVHRDVKPSNLLLTPGRQVKVSDFGLARRFDGTRTPHKAVIGSLEFLAPEQLSDATTAGPPADVYGLGVTLFWVYSGKLPYPEGLTASELVDYLLTLTPYRVKRFDPDTPAAFDDLLAKMTARNPADRPTMPEVAAALAALAGPVSHPEVAGELFIPDDTTEADALRYGVRALHERLTDLTAELADVRDAVLIGLQSAVTRCTGETAGHVRRVAASARLLARQLSRLPNWSGYQSKAAESELARAATLHDLGLIGMSDGIDPGAVSRTPSEEHEYRAHPLIGAKMLDELAERHGGRLPYMRMLRDVVRHHHERWDGTGWPDALAGQRIPPAARVVTVADAYDRLRAPGADKRGMAHADAVAAVVREAGSKYDPEVISAFKATADQIGQVFDSIPDDLAPPDDASKPAE